MKISTTPPTFRTGTMVTVTDPKSRLAGRTGEVMGHAAQKNGRDTLVIFRDKALESGYWLNDNQLAAAKRQYQDTTGK